MEQMIHLAKTLYTQYAAELVLGMLACLVILTIITLITVRRCKRQVKYLDENTKEFMQYSMRRSAEEARSGARRGDDGAEETGPGKRGVTSEDEEVFGSVIREMFS